MKTAYIITNSGKEISLTAPKPEHIDIEDIAHSLSMLCRFNGQCKYFYSVADHSIRVAKELMGTEYELAGLLHDAAEAYIGDVTSPLKSLLGYEFENIETEFLLAISRRFNIPPYNLVCPEVKKADLSLLATEAHFLMPEGKSKLWSGLPEPSFDFAEPRTQADAERNFLEYFEHLSAKL